MNQEKIYNKVCTFLDAIKKVYGENIISISNLKSLAKENRISIPSVVWGVRNEMKKIDLQKVEELYGRCKDQHAQVELSEPMREETPIARVKEKEESATQSFDMYIPHVNPSFLPVGDNYKIINKIIKSAEYFPTYIYGVSGIGKTASIEHICAMNKRPYFRVQITAETIDDDLIGSIRLKDGNTVWQDGPIITAYRCGGIVVLDEIDLNPNLMILQGILERKPFYIKQTGELVNPAPGFMVFATGNTKGDGSDYRFIGTQVLNDAFLDRFGMTLYQTFMSEKHEYNVAVKYCQTNNVDIDQELLKRVVSWTHQSRSIYESSPEDSVYISTRRLQFILKHYKIFRNINIAISKCLERYQEEHRVALEMLWKAFSTNEDTNTDESGSSPENNPQNDE